MIPITILPREIPREINSFGMPRRNGGNNSFGMYSFSLHPEAYQPQGSINFSRVDNAPSGHVNFSRMDNARLNFSNQNSGHYFNINNSNNNSNNKMIFFRNL